MSDVEHPNLLTEGAAEDSSEAIRRSVEEVSRIAFLPSMLRILCQETGMGFAAVARVTAGAWTACAVRDEIGFGLTAGGQLDIHSTLCKESRAHRATIAIDHASQDERYRDHPTARGYGIESYISAPIVLPTGEYFGNLCAVDRKPARASAPQIVAQFESFSRLVAEELQRGRAEDERATALADERAAGALREEFIAVLGHDLRNPLSAIFTSADLVAKRGADEPSRAAGKRILASARRMSRLIDDVMDFARGRLGGGIGAHMAVEPDFGALVADVAAESRASHPGRAIEARVDVPVEVVCDRGRIQQLLSNLLGNALHHGDPASPIEVEAGVLGDRVRLAVSNRGAPIAAEHLARIFEPYWRPPGSAAGGGLGLGLHICARIAEAHGGTVSASSSAAGDIRFEARMPIAGPPGWREGD